MLYIARIIGILLIVPATYSMKQKEEHKMKSSNRIDGVRGHKLKCNTKSNRKKAIAKVKANPLNFVWVTPDEVEEAIRLLVIQIKAPITRSIVGVRGLGWRWSKY